MGTTFSIGTMLRNAIANRQKWAPIARASVTWDRRVVAGEIRETQDISYWESFSEAQEYVNAKMEELGAGCSGCVQTITIKLLEPLEGES